MRKLCLGLFHLFTITILKLIEHKHIIQGGKHNIDAHVMIRRHFALNSL